MKLLLDTHAVVWSILQVARLSPAALDAISDPESTVFVSVASAWEMSIKVGLGKWPQASPLLTDLETTLASTGFEVLPMTIAHALAAGIIQSRHRDPFDRMLAAQAVAEGMTLVTADAEVQSLGAPWVW